MPDSFFILVEIIGIPIHVSRFQAKAFLDRPGGPHLKIPLHFLTMNIREEDIIIYIHISSLRVADHLMFLAHLLA